MSNKAHDPFGSIRRVEEDQVGVRTWDKEHTTPGVVIFHTVVDNKVRVIDSDGSVIMDFADVPDGYQLYRPGKAGDNRSIHCILKHRGRFQDRSIAALTERGEVIWKTPHHHFTHDFHVRNNKRVVTVIRVDELVDGLRISDNVIVDMDIYGNITWQWSVLHNLSKLEIGDQIRTSISRYNNNNPFHVNSVQIADYPVVLEKFGEPAIVVSARNMNSVFLVGQHSGNVIFEYSGKTMGQHHARLLPEVYPSGETSSS